MELGELRYLTSWMSCKLARLSCILVLSHDKLLKSRINAVYVDL